MFSRDVHEVNQVHVAFSASSQPSQSQCVIRIDMASVHHSVQGQQCTFTRASHGFVVKYTADACQDIY